MIQLVLLFCLFATSAGAAPEVFPTLSGRIVDEAGLISSSVETEIDELLATHERSSGNQVVVVTLKSLHGYKIEEYGLKLGNQWGVGQKEKNNGVLLIVTPSERRMRIEVGSGLEDKLTDEVCFDIVTRVIQPFFKQENFDQGILNGVVAILAALESSHPFAPPSEFSMEPNPSSKENSWSAFIEDVGIWSFIMPFALPVIIFLAYIMNSKLMLRYPTRSAQLLLSTLFGVFMGSIIGIAFGGPIAGVVSGLLLAGLAFVARHADGLSDDNESSSHGRWHRRSLRSNSSNSSNNSYKGGGGSFGGGGSSGRW